MQLSDKFNSGYYRSEHQKPPVSILKYTYEGPTVKRNSKSVWDRAQIYLFLKAPQEILMCNSSQTLLIWIILHKYYLPQLQYRHSM